MLSWSATNLLVTCYLRKKNNRNKASHEQYVVTQQIAQCQIDVMHITVPSVKI